MLGSIGAPEIIVLLTLGILLFGRKLPDIGRSLGKTMVEFKKGMKGIEDEVSESGNTTTRQAIEPEPVKPPTRVTPSAAPRFEDAAPSTLPPKV